MRSAEPTAPAPGRSASPRGCSTPTAPRRTRSPARAARRRRRRYDVYRNNVTVSLIDALAAVYPGHPAHHRAGLLQGDGALPRPRHAADLAVALRVRPRLPRLHRSATSTRGRCRGSPTWRGSSAPGSTPTTPPTQRRCRRRRSRQLPPERLPGTRPRAASGDLGSCARAFRRSSIFAANRREGAVGPIGTDRPGGRARHAGPALGGRRPAPAAGRSRVRHPARRRRPARRGRRCGPCREPGIRPCRQHRRDARGGRVHAQSEGDALTT